MTNKKEQECFVIMPISDHKDYEPGHFKRVYEDVIVPACEKANFKAIRADDVEETDMIHLSILKKLIEAPMAICDLSTRNPNVLFELGLRQAFDKPVVLIQEKGTERIFDISILRAYDYCKELKYKDVLDDQENIAKMLKGTEKSFVTGEGFNSVIKLLSLTQGAHIKIIDDPNEQFKMQLFQLSSQMDYISTELGFLRNEEDRISKRRDSKNRIPDKLINSQIASFYENFLHHYNRNNFEMMISIYESVQNLPIRSAIDLDLIDQMRKRIVEYETDIKNE